MRKWVILAVALACAACNQNPAQNADGGGDTSSQAAASSDGPRFYGRETFTITYASTGTQTGPSTEHIRNWGNQRVDIQNTSTTIAMAGFSNTQVNNSRTIYDGDKIININTDTGATTITTSPIYDQLVSAIGNGEGVNFGMAMMQQMGGQPTGETGNYAGQTCHSWQLAQAGTRTCITDWGGSLFTETNLGPMSFTRTATEVRLGDGGPDSAFQYDAANATAGPDLGSVNLNELLEKAKSGN
jgi:hypothetical protein